MVYNHPVVVRGRRVIGLVIRYTIMGSVPHGLRIRIFPQSKISIFEARMSFAISYGYHLVSIAAQTGVLKIIFDYVSQSNENFDLVKLGALLGAGVVGLKDMSTVIDFILRNGLAVGYRLGISFDILEKIGLCERDFLYPPVFGSPATLVYIADFTLGPILRGLGRRFGESETFQRYIETLGQYRNPNDFIYYR